MAIVHNRTPIGIVKERLYGKRHQSFCIMYHFSPDIHHIGLSFLHFFQYHFQAIVCIGIITIQQSYIGSVHQLQSTITGRRGCFITIVQFFKKNIAVVFKHLFQLRQIMWLTIVNNYNPLNIFESDSLPMHRRNTFIEKSHIHIVKWDNNRYFICHTIFLL